SYRYAAIWEVSAAGNVLSLQTVPLPDGAVFSTAVDVNDSGLVVGYWGNSDPLHRTYAAFADVPGAGISVLSSGSAYAPPKAVNNEGIVVDTDGVLRQVNPNGTVTTLGYLEYSFEPWDINDQLVFAGQLNFQPAI